MELESSVWMANVLRTFPIVLGAITLGITFRVLQLYWHAYRNEWKYRDRRTGGGHRGLLPLHVSTISLSHLTLTAYVMLSQVRRLGNDLFPVDYAMATFGMIFGLYALVTILRFEHRRVQLQRTRQGQPDAAWPPPSHAERRHEARQDAHTVASLIVRGMALVTMVVVVAATILTLSHVSSVMEDGRAVSEQNREYLRQLNEQHEDPPP